MGIQQIGFPKAQLETSHLIHPHVCGHVLPGLCAFGTAMFMTRLASCGLGGEAVNLQMPDSDGVLDVRLSV